MSLATTEDKALETATLRRVSWRLMPFLLTAYLLCYIDRVNVGFASLQRFFPTVVCATRSPGFARSLRALRLHPASDTNTRHDTVRQAGTFMADRQRTSKRDAARNRRQHRRRHAAS